MSLPDGMLALVDKKHGLDPGSVPPDLSVLDGLPIAVNRKELKLRRAAIPDLLKMSEAARREGLDLMVISAYRSYAYQAEVYQRNVQELGQKQADRESARPGHSQHQLGTAVDLCSLDPSFARTKEGKWLEERAWRYGFSLSFPKGEEELTGVMYEPWHYRYLGRGTARLVREFFLDSQQRFLEYLDRHAAFFRERLEKS